MDEMILLKYCGNGEDWDYAIAQMTISAGQTTHPLVHFDSPRFIVPVVASSISELKILLRKMLKACDQVETVLEPERLVQAKLRKDVANG